MSQLWELRTTIRPAVLVELAFASNSDDLAKMHDPAWCSRMAEAIAAGVSKSE
jgi:N-acetylmuramoyl-L-alanine amidase